MMPGRDDIARASIFARRREAASSQLHDRAALAREEGPRGKTTQESVDCLRYHGRIVNLGLAGRDVTPFNPLPLWGKNAALIGMSLMTSLQNEHARTHGVIAECIARVAAGELRVIVEQRYALADAAKAHAHIERRSVFGRVVMLPRGV